MIRLIKVAAIEILITNSTYWPSSTISVEGCITSAMISHLRRRSRVIHVSHGMERVDIVETV